MYVGDDVSTDFCLGVSQIQTTSGPALCRRLKPASKQLQAGIAPTLTENWWQSKIIKVEAADQTPMGYPLYSLSCPYWSPYFCLSLLQLREFALLPNLPRMLPSDWRVSNGGTRIPEADLKLCLKRWDKKYGITYKVLWTSSQTGFYRTICTTKPLCRSVLTWTADF